VENSYKEHAARNSLLLRHILSPDDQKPLETVFPCGHLCMAKGSSVTHRDRLNNSSGEEEEKII
jgi:hypothetical protein